MKIADQITRGEDENGNEYFEFDSDRFPTLGEAILGAQAMCMESALTRFVADHAGEAEEFRWANHDLLAELAHHPDFFNKMKEVIEQF